MTQTQQIQIKQGLVKIPPRFKEYWQNQPVYIRFSPDAIYITKSSGSNKSLVEAAFKKAKGILSGEANGVEYENKARGRIISKEGVSIGYSAEEITDREEKIETVKETFGTWNKGLSGIEFEDKIREEAEKHFKDL